MSIASLVLVLISLAHASGLDPRFDCANRLESDLAVHDWLFHHGHADRADLEHTYVSGALLIDRPMGLKAFVPRTILRSREGEARLVAVTPGSKPFVLEVGHRGRLRRARGRVGNEVWVPAFGKNIVWRLEKGWEWRTTAPPKIEVGDVPKRWFLEHYRTPLEELMRRNEWSPEVMRTAVIYEGWLRIKPLHLMYYHHAETRRERTLVFDPEQQREVDPQNVSDQMIRFKNGLRLMRRDSKWVVLPRVQWQSDQNVVEDTAQFEVFEAHPRALETFIREVAALDLRLRDIKVERVVDEVDQHPFLMLSGSSTDGAEPSQYYLFDEASSSWVSITDQRDRTFVRADGSRLGHGIGDAPGWRKLPLHEDFDRAIAWWPE